jgi:hypothetical protein
VRDGAELAGEAAPENSYKEKNYFSALKKESAGPLSRAAAGNYGTPVCFFERQFLQSLEGLTVASGKRDEVTVLLANRWEAALLRPR